ncbi:MAG: hypothetical protein HYU36_23555 [Planctomycetes bacterium]|nr:hypothetical protein [Planctomycetota bacterium]
MSEALSIVSFLLIMIVLFRLKTLIREVSAVKQELEKMTKAKSEGN